MEEVVLAPNDSVVGLVCPASLRVEHTDPPRPESPVDPPAREDRHWRDAGVEPDAPRVEQLHPARCAEVQQAARFEEELALFREAKWKSSEGDELYVGLH